jgi:uncharacterized phosphosugar-binding protein
MEKKMLIYVGPGEFTIGGITFESGHVYSVDEEVFEWAKGMRYFHPVKRIRQKIMKFR